MSEFIERIPVPPSMPDFAASGDKESYADYANDVAGLDLSRVLLNGSTHLASAHHPVDGPDIAPLEEIIAGNLEQRSKIRSDIAHLNDGHSDPTMIAVDIREINQHMGELALETQVVMKVEQSGIGAVKQLLSGQ